MTSSKLITFFSESRQHLIDSLSRYVEERGGSIELTDNSYSRIEDDNIVPYSIKNLRVSTRYANNKVLLVDYISSDKIYTDEIIMFSMDEIWHILNLLHL